MEDKVVELQKALLAKEGVAKNDLAVVIDAFRSCVDQYAQHCDAFEMINRLPGMLTDIEHKWVMLESLQAQKKLLEQLMV